MIYRTNSDKLFRRGRSCVASHSKIENWTNAQFAEEKSVHPLRKKKIRNEREIGKILPENMEKIFMLRLHCIFVQPTLMIHAIT